MFSTRLGLVALACLPALAQVPAQTPTERIAPFQLGTIRDKVEHPYGQAESTNWSGYAVTGSSFTSAVGSWVVPTITCSSSGGGGFFGGGSSDQYAAFWVGIDGYSSDSVEQTGTLGWCDGKTAEYYAWYEFYPNPMYEITTVPVSPGNVISASVTYGTSGFTVTITNVTTGKSYNKTSTVSGAARSSAEWITEAPCCTNSGGILPLAQFSTAEFGKDWTSVSGTNFATDSSNSGNIASFPGYIDITKVGSSTSPQTSTCSALSSDGTSFTCTWAQ